jgi:metallo-beta-lactamase family protein
VRLSFHGADREVTGSCHMIEWGDRRILVDCGFRQGAQELEEENAQPFGFDPAAVDFLLLTHAHLDHCGRLPLLVKQGFQGEVIATAATRELTRIIILDAAHLQEEAERQSRPAGYRERTGAARAPLYSVREALRGLERFGRNAEYDTPLELAPGLRATFLDAGHILGSASILLEGAESGGRRRILFSGDLGNVGRPLLRPPIPPPRADAVILEATYGNRLHRPYQESVEELFTAISNTLGRGGNVLIPTFALERAQELLYAINQGIEASRLPPTIQAFLDSPLAIAATEVFTQYPACYEPDIARVFSQGRDPFSFPGLHIARDVADSIAIGRITGGAVILAGSGMCTGGRIRHHLKRNLWRREASIIFVGYAARGTTARRIIDGAATVRLLGEEVPVRASIHTINGFSAHADQRDLVAWHDRIREKSTTFLVHGEEEVMRQLAPHLHDTRVEMPTLHQSFEL